MKTIKNIFCFFLLSTLIVINLPAQSSKFNLEDYKEFLNSHQNISSTNLLQMHPAGKFVSNIHQNINAAFYFDSIEVKYKITDYEKTLIAKNGFMVSERLTEPSFGKAYLEIFQNDLPVFVSTDAILHALHVSYDRILKDVELSIIIDKLKTYLDKLHSGMVEIAAKYSNKPEMNIMLRDVDLYLTVPLKLLDENSQPYYSSNSTKINSIMTKIFSEQSSADTIFSGYPVTYDWSQFKPRGHYIDKQNPVLEKYFRAMMWLGRIELYLLPPRALTFADPVQIYNDVKRQTIDALLLNELYLQTNAEQEYEEIEDLLKFFVGKPDNVTLPDIQYLDKAVSINSADELLDSLKFIGFQDTLKNQSFAHQLILSQILIHDPYKPDSIIPASAFLMFGQRFVIDSYIMSQVVFDKTKTCRLFPLSLDPMFVLGNNAAAQLLTSEIDKYNYGENLAALRYLVDTYQSEFWQSTIYNLWLNSIRTLNPPVNRDNLPSFMKTGAFWQEKLNTQLASWAELRHDNLLYAKQSYTGATACSYPYSYVEPFPEFFKNIKMLAEKAEEKFSNYSSQKEYLILRITDYFNYLKNTADTLEIIAQKELDGIRLSQVESDFLKKMAYNKTNGSGELPFDGWYPRLFYIDGMTYPPAFLTQENVVADVHTIPTDCAGGVMGWVMHVGMGPVNLGVFLADIPGHQTTAFIGPVMSYYEYTTTNFQRLTDQEWEDTYLLQSLRPSWVNYYLADANGNSKGEGLKLITSVDDYKNELEKGVPEDFISTKIFPNPTNPFNPSVTISFNVPYKMSGSYVELNIYNIQGKLIKKLLGRNLSSGKYLYRWDGTNAFGTNVASGIYIANLRVANQQHNQKLMLLK